MVNYLIFLIVFLIMYFIGIIINFVLITDIIKDFIYNDMYKDYIFNIDKDYSIKKNYFIILMDLIILIIFILGSFLSTIFIMRFIDNNKL